MTVTEIGTDDATTLYAQGESIRQTVERMSESLATMPQNVTELNLYLKALGEVQIEILNRLDTIAVDVSQTGDRAVEASTAAMATVTKVTDMQATQRVIVAGQANTDALIGAFTGWLQPLLDSFRDSDILPTMAAIDGKTQVLLDSHEEIKTLVNRGLDMVTPLITRLETSPLLRMLGVKDS